LRGWLPSAGRGKPIDLLHSVDRMRAILDRERMRSDRGNSTFALLTLSLGRPVKRNDLPLLAGTVQGRIRATDDAGFLGPRQLGIVLPETPAAGAWKLAADIGDLLPRGVQRPWCEVYVYPGDDEQQDSELRGGGRRDADLRDEVPCDEDSCEQESREEVAVAEDEASEDRREARPMHVLFAQPLPTWKRAIDVVGASLAIALASPVLLLIAAIIRLTSPGPVIFKQRRDALGGRPFTIFKFRTMSVDAELQKADLLAHSEQDGPAFKIAKDPRVTRIGRFLRVTSLDELPQLFNVLAGDMSLVGPRPLPCDESQRCEAWQRRRLDVTPGLTCIWQIRGRSAVSFAEWIRMDIEYIRSRSLINDVKLIAQTVPAVALRRGAC
jgi:lipopolysaccharide/colanic/teichoic acid biosynthesis glycosyltransferase